MSFQTVEQLQAEIERLRALVKDAYVEGYDCGSTDPIDYFDHSWLTSDARAALQFKEDAQ